jgi:hypothetical protein
MKPLFQTLEYARVWNRNTLESVFVFLLVTFQGSKPNLWEINLAWKDGLLIDLMNAITFFWLLFLVLKIEDLKLKQRWLFWIGGLPNKYLLAMFHFHLCFFKNSLLFWKSFFFSFFFLMVLYFQNCMETVLGEYWNYRSYVWNAIGAWTSFYKGFLFSS